MRFTAHRAFLSERIGGQHFLFVRADYLGGGPAPANLPAVNPKNSLAQPANLVELMADQHDRAPRPRNVAHFPETFFLKLDVANRENLVTRRISGSRCAATANARRTYIPLE